MKLKEKADREGADMREYKKNPRYQTAEEIFCNALDEEQADEANPLKLTEEQILQRKRDKEREIYGRFWIWEGYFSEKN